ncbi:MAG: sugar kinase [Sphingomicrobium sp.]
MDLNRTGPILCFGEVLLRLSASPGTRLSSAQNLEVHVGGAEANVGAALAALGLDVEMVTALPDGQLGDLCVAELRRAGLGTHLIARGEGRLGTYFLEHGVPPRPAAIVYDRAGSLFSKSADRFNWPSLAKQAGWFHLCGINLPISTQGSTGALAAVDAMKAGGVPVSFDVNHRASMWEGRAAKAAELEHLVMQSTDLLFASPRDICRALGCDVSEATPQGRREAAEAAFDAFPSVQLIVSTRRDIQLDRTTTLTVRVENRETSHETDPTPIGTVVDRIGTGDAMAGVVIDAVLRGATIVEIAQLGVAAAVLKHGIAGDQWVGTAAELEAFHGKRQGDVLR